jgi:DNA polymerase-1
MAGVQKDLFESTLVQDKIAYVKKSKNISWLETANLLLVNTEAELRQLVTEALATDTPKAVDTETTGITKDDKLVGVSVSWKKHDTGNPIAFYVPLYSEVEEVGIPPYTTLAILKPLIEQPCIWYNFKFDYQVFKTVGFEAGLLADVSIMENFPKDGVDNTEFNRLKHTGLKQRFKDIFDLDMLSLSDVLGKGVYNFSLAPLELAKSYATVDAYATLMLYYHYVGLIDQKGFIYNLETKVVSIVANMEYQGVKIDLGFVKEVREELISENKEFSKKVYELAGEEFNIGSGPMLTHVLYEKLKLPVLKFIEDDKGNKTTKPSTDKDALNLLKGKHEIIEPLIKYKENLKLINTFLDKLRDGIASDGNIHTSYRPYGTISGRFISIQPNLQQVPKSDDDESNKATIRKCFIASPGYYFLDFDYSQVEYRILASLSKDPELIKAFENDDTDFHQQTASVMFGIPYDKVSSADRKKGKNLNFGLAYGLGAKTLAGKLSCTEEEAQKLYDMYFEKMPTTKIWMDETHSRIVQQQFSTSFHGRVRKLPGAKSTERGKRFAAMREGLNHEIQSTSADITKIAMVRCGKAIAGTGIRILLQVHDELLFEVPESFPVQEAVNLIRNAMQLPIKEFVKLRVDASIGRNWGNCVAHIEGKGLEQIPEEVENLKPTSLFIEGALVEKGEELKNIFKKFPGECMITLRIGGTELVPTDVVGETGEVLEVKVSPSEAFLREVKELGLVATIS